MSANIKYGITKKMIANQAWYKLLQLGLVFLTTPCYSQDPPPIPVLLKPLPDATDRAKLFQTLVNIGKPVTIQVRPKESVSQAIARKCGTVSPELTAVVLRLNSKLVFRRTSHSRKINFIACPYWKLSDSSMPITVPVKQNEKIQNVVPLFLGTNSADAINEVKLLNPGLVQSDGSVLRNAMLRLPYINFPAKIKLKDDADLYLQAMGASNSIGSIIRYPIGAGFGSIGAGLGIVRLSKPISVLAQANEAERLVKNIAAIAPKTMPSELLKENLEIARSTALSNKGYFIPVDNSISENSLSITSSCGELAVYPWPFNMANVQAIMKGNHSRLQGKGKRSIVLVIDTGLDNRNDRYKALLWDKSKTSSHTQHLRISNDKYGADMNTLNGNIAPPQKYAYALHGTQVVAEISGGSGVDSPLAEYLQIAIAKVVDGPPGFGIDTDSISRAFMYARAIDADTIQLSILAGSIGHSLKVHLNSVVDRTLVVMASGNDGLDVQSADVYPPKLVDAREQALVVGAHDRFNKHTKFSNYGREVDLLALGCHIPVNLGGSETTYVSGTSFAAPLVTLVAALLQSLNFSANQAMNRILATVDLDSKLKPRIRFEGRLNVEKALNVFDDLVTIRQPDKSEPKMLLGTLDRSQYWNCRTSEGDRPYLVGQVVRLVADNVNGKLDATSGLWRIWGKVEGGKIREEWPCENLTGKISFQASGSTSTELLKWADIIEIIPALRMPDE